MKRPLSPKGKVVEKEFQNIGLAYLSGEDRTGNGPIGTVMRSNCGTVKVVIENLCNVAKVTKGKISVVTVMPIYTPKIEVGIALQASNPDTRFEAGEAVFSGYQGRILLIGDVPFNGDIVMMVKPLVGSIQI